MNNNEPYSARFGDGSDVDDLILNLAGALVTWLVLWPLSRHINNLLRRNRYDS